MTLRTSSKLRALIEKHIRETFGPAVAQIQDVLRPFVQLHGVEVVKEFFSINDVLEGLADEGKPSRGKPSRASRDVTKKYHRRTLQRITRRKMRSKSAPQDSKPSKVQPRGGRLTHSTLLKPIRDIIVKIAKDKSSFTIDNITPELDKIGRPYSRVAVTQILSNGKFIRGIKASRKVKSPISGRQVNCYLFTNEPIELARKRK
jgi:hypothetical protein